MLTNEMVTAAYHRLLDRFATEVEKTAIDRGELLQCPSEGTLMDRTVDMAAVEPEISTSYLLAALELAGRDQDRALSREMRVVGWLRDRGVPWHAIASHRGLHSAQAAMQRYQRHTKAADLIFAFRPTGLADAPWRGDPNALPEGQFETGTIEFNPSMPRPFSGQTLEVRYGPADAQVMPSYLRVYAQVNGRRIAATAAVQLELFGG